MRYLESLNVQNNQISNNNNYNNINNHTQLKYYISNNSNSLNINKYNNNNNSNTNNLTLNSNSNLADNIPTHKESKDYNLTFNYNLLNNTCNSNLTNNECESRDPQQSILTNKNSHISGFKYDKGQTESFESLLNNSKSKILNNNSSNCNSNNNISLSNNINNVLNSNNFNFNNNLSYNQNNNNRNFKNNFSEKNLGSSGFGIENTFDNGGKNAKVFSTFENNNLNNIQNANVNLSSEVIYKSNIDGKNLNNFSLPSAHFSNNIINNISTDKNIFIYNSLQSTNGQVNPITNISFIEEKDKNTSICFNVIQEENKNNTNKNNIDFNNDSELNYIKFKTFNKNNNFEFENNNNNKDYNDNNSNVISLKSKIEIGQSNPEEKKNVYFEDLDDIVFPDKVKMRSVSLKKNLPKLYFNFNNKSVDLRKHNKVIDFTSNNYTDSYNIDLDNTSFIMNDRSKARVIKKIYFLF